MSIYSYSVFITVAEQLSFTKAAVLLNLTPSAISHMIAKLEEKFGFNLFVRGKKGLQLTENGLQVLRFVQNAVSASILLEQKVVQIQGLTQGTLRIGTINSVAVNWLPDILAEYQKEYPAVDIKIVQSGYNKLIDNMVMNKLDLAFVSHSSIRHLDTAFQFIPLHKDRLMCVSPVDYIPANEGFVTVDEIKNMNLIFHEDGDEVDIVSFLRKSHLSNTSNFSIFNDTSLVSMVKCGFGHSIMPELSLRGLILDNVHIYPIVPFACRELGIITAHPKYLTPTAQKMIAHIQKYIVEQGL